MKELILFYVPVPDEATARALTGGALKARLAACGNILGPVTSLYEWKGEMCDGPEHVLVLKTPADREEALAEWLEREHPYECPCVARRTERVNDAFYDWVVEQTRSG